MTPTRVGYTGSEGAKAALALALPLFLFGLTPSKYTCLQLTILYRIYDLLRLSTTYYDCLRLTTTIYYVLRLRGS